MLEILRSIVQEVNLAKDLKSALGIVVEKIHKALHANATGIYLLDQNKTQFTLRAARGLKQEAIGNVKLKFSEGLVGLVGTRAEPINLGDATRHSNFCFFPEIGEEEFHSFLGVPIVHHRNVLGVLVVQSESHNKFDDDTEAFLVTLASQLAVVLAHAKATGAVLEIQQANKNFHTIFEGVAGAPGVAMGQVVVLYPPADLDAVPNKQANDKVLELKLFNKAVHNVKRDIRAVSMKLAGKLGVQERELFNVYIKMLDDQAIGGEVAALINQGQWAQGALRDVIQKHEAAFSSMSDTYLKERASDVRDLGRRILAYLQEKQQKKVDFPDNTILVGEELTAANLGEVPKNKLVGLVSIKGSKYAHISILARSMDIPIVVAAMELPYKQLNGIEAIVDGYQGKVFPNPTDELKQHFGEVIHEEENMVSGLEVLIDKPSQTTDDYNIPLRVNTGLVSDIARSIQYGAEGVGLYRTEVPFMMTDCFPSEAQQCEFYREHLKAFVPHPVTMRTLDVGGDKALPYFPIKEENPFLGWRGIRITLDHTDIFLVQIRAMLKASEGLHNLRIMLPMITNIEEVEEAIKLIHQAYAEIKDEGFDIIMPLIGVMIEVPAAVYQARALAHQVDFLSVGSNDLTQYLLAVDRNNNNVAGMYHAFHPAVLKALESIVNNAHLENKKVSVCGELAGNPAGAILLMAMGYDELSMSASNILRVKAAIRHISLSKAKQILQEVLQMERVGTINSYMDKVMLDMGLARIDTSILAESSTTIVAIGDNR